jgi:hypothetical protein
MLYQALQKCITPRPPLNPLSYVSWYTLKTTLAPPNHDELPKVVHLVVSMPIDIWKE